MSWRQRTSFLSIALCTLAAMASFSIAAHGAERTPAQQELYKRAQAACNSPAYPNGARIIISYSGGWFRCEERRSERR